MLPEPPTPWTLAEDGTDGPVGWRAQLGDRGPERSFGLPLLVTLSRTGASTLLANIGAMGVLAVDGPPVEERRRLRAMSLEVATSRISVPVEVAVAGDARLASLDQVRHIDDPTGEIELAMDEVEQEIVLDDRNPRLLVCHRDIDPPVVPSDLTGMVGVAVAGCETSGPWVLVIEAENIGVYDCQTVAPSSSASRTSTRRWSMTSWRASTRVRSLHSPTRRSPRRASRRRTRSIRLPTDTASPRRPARRSPPGVRCGSWGRSR